MNCERTVLSTHKIASPPHKTYSFCLQIHSVSDLPGLYLFLCFRDFVSFATSCSLGEQNHFLWSDSGLKQFTPVSSSLSVICCYPSPAISVLLSPVGFFDLFVSWWCTRSSIEELIWTTNNFILFYVEQASLAAVLHSTVGDLLQQYERPSKMLRALQQWGKIALNNQCNSINKHCHQRNGLQNHHLVPRTFSLNCLNSCTSYLCVASPVLDRWVCKISQWKLALV